MKTDRKTKPRPTPDNKDKGRAPENKTGFKPGAHVSAAGKSEDDNYLSATYVIPVSERVIVETDDGKDRVTLERGASFACIITGGMIRLVDGVAEFLGAPALPGTPAECFCVVPLPDAGDVPQDDGTAVHEIYADGGISLAYAPARTEIQTLSLLTAYTGYIISGSVYAREEPESHDVRPRKQFTAGQTFNHSQARPLSLCTQEDDCRLLIFERRKFPSLTLYNAGQLAKP